MLINDLVISARRILGDTSGHGWTPERMLDIVNSGLRDMNKMLGSYRSEHFFELQAYRNRYPLPVDLLSVTSLRHNGAEVHLRNQADSANELYATKDQLNIGILELKNIPVVTDRNKRLFGGPTGFIVPQPEFDLWSDGTWNNTSAWRDDQLWGMPYVFEDALGIAVNPLLNPLGVTTGVVLSASVYEGLVPTNRGLLSDIHIVGSTVSIGSSGDTFGVLTAFDTADYTMEDGGSIGTIPKLPYRVAGRYGTVTSVLRGEEYVQVRYKALPKTLNSLETAFPMSPAFIEPMINWIVGTALQDDNDANNTQRAQVFLQRYVRDMEHELAASNTDYSNASKKYVTHYNGGIK